MTADTATESLKSFEGRVLKESLDSARSILDDQSAVISPGLTAISQWLDGGNRVTADQVDDASTITGKSDLRVDDDAENVLVRYKGFLNSTKLQSFNTLTGADISSYTTADQIQNDLGNVTIEDASSLTPLKELIRRNESDKWLKVSYESGPIINDKPYLNGASNSVSVKVLTSTTPNALVGGSFYYVTPVSGNRSKVIDDLTAVVRFDQGSSGTLVPTRNTDKIPASEGLIYQIVTIDTATAAIDAAYGTLDPDDQTMFTRIQALTDQRVEAPDTQSPEMSMDAFLATDFEIRTQDKLDAVLNLNPNYTGTIDTVTQALLQVVVDSESKNVHAKALTGDDTLTIDTASPPLREYQPESGDLESISQLFQVGAVPDVGVAKILLEGTDETNTYQPFPYVLDELTGGLTSGHTLVRETTITLRPKYTGRVRVTNIRLSGEKDLENDIPPSYLDTLFLGSFYRQDHELIARVVNGFNVNKVVNSSRDDIFYKIAVTLPSEDSDAVSALENPTKSSVPRAIPYENYTQRNSSLPAQTDFPVRLGVRYIILIAEPLTETWRSPSLTGRLDLSLVNVYVGNKIKLDLTSQKDVRNVISSNDYTGRYHTRDQDAASSLATDINRIFEVHPDVTHTYVPEIIPYSIFHWSYEKDYSSYTTKLKPSWVVIDLAYNKNVTSVEIVTAPGAANPPTRLELHSDIEQGSSKVWEKSLVEYDSSAGFQKTVLGPHPVINDIEINVVKENSVAHLLEPTTDATADIVEYRDKIWKISDFQAPLPVDTVPSRIVIYNRNSDAQMSLAHLDIFSEDGEMLQASDVFTTGPHDDTVPPITHMEQSLNKFVSSHYEWYLPNTTINIDVNGLNISFSTGNVPEWLKNNTRSVLYFKNEDGRVDQVNNKSLTVTYWQTTISRKSQLEDGGELKTDYDALTDDEKEAADAFADAPIDGLLDRMAALPPSGRKASIDTGGSLRNLYNDADLTTQQLADDLATAENDSILYRLAEVKAVVSFDESNIKFPTESPIFISPGMFFFYSIEGFREIYPHSSEVLLRSPFLTMDYDVFYGRFSGVGTTWLRNELSYAYRVGVGGENETEKFLNIPDSHEGSGVWWYRNVTPGSSESFLYALWRCPAETSWWRQPVTDPNTGGIVTTIVEETLDIGLTVMYAQDIEGWSKDQSKIYHVLPIGSSDLRDASVMSYNSSWNSWRLYTNEFTTKLDNNSQVYVIEEGNLLNTGSPLGQDCWVVSAVAFSSVSLEDFTFEWPPTKSAVYAVSFSQEQDPSNVQDWLSYGYLHSNYIYQWDRVPTDETLFESPQFNFVGYGGANFLLKNLDDLNGSWFFRGVLDYDGGIIDRSEFKILEIENSQSDHYPTETSSIARDMITGETINILSGEYSDGIDARMASNGSSFTGDLLLLHSRRAPNLDEVYKTGSSGEYLQQPNFNFGRLSNYKLRTTWDMRYTPGTSRLAPFISASGRHYSTKEMKKISKVRIWPSTDNASYMPSHMAVYSRDGYILEDRQLDLDPGTYNDIHLPQDYTQSVIDDVQTSAQRYKYANSDLTQAAAGVRLDHARMGDVEGYNQQMITNSLAARPLVSGDPVWFSPWYRERRTFLGTSSSI